MLVTWPKIPFVYLRQRIFFFNFGVMACGLHPLVIIQWQKAQLTICSKCLNIVKMCITVYFLACASFVIAECPTIEEQGQVCEEVEGEEERRS